MPLAGRLTGRAAGVLYGSMRNRSELANLTMADVQRLHVIRSMLARLQAEMAPADGEERRRGETLILRADLEAERIMRKAARPAVRFLRQGGYRRLVLHPELVAELERLADLPAAEGAADAPGDVGAG